MARLRKAVAYRRIERPYTRISKYKSQSFIRTSYNTRIVRFDMGNLQKKFPVVLSLKSKTDIQIRDNAVNSARETCNRVLEKTLGTPAYHFKVNKYPFHILRENPLASGAGADRFSTGMKKAFGKPIGQSIQVRKGESIFTVSTSKNNLEVAKKALHRAATKFPCSCQIVVSEVKLPAAK